MHLDDDIDALRTRVQIARNSSDLSKDVINALKTAHEIRVGAIEIHRGKFPIALRHYTIVRFDQIFRVEEEDAVDSDGKTKVRRRTVATRTEKTVHAWEVQGFLPDVAEMSGCWIYEDPEVAASCMAYLLMTLLETQPSENHEEEVDLSDLLMAVMSSKAIGVSGERVIPKAPRDDATKKNDDKKALETRAIEARTMRASTDLRKQIALDLYLSGEKNIRRIGKLTGLARDTIYKVLKARKLIGAPSPPISPDGPQVTRQGTPEASGTGHFEHE
ncbi:hypothetical protein GCM10010149_23860 [Nonomuraea roseoviolacea subsp. roseoviolacea]|uniref:hypothetical protein n=1 Tax=Nonomuraea roseoviolacea TaxID=103837 RepID=UPI0031D85166